MVDGVLSTGRDERLVVVVTRGNDNNKREVTKGVKVVYQYQLDEDRRRI
jgi:hypothetical protein